MKARPLLLRLLCLFGLHSWRAFPAAGGDAARRTCGRCGRWQKLVPDESGWASGHWQDF